MSEHDMTAGQEDDTTVTEPFEVAEVTEVTETAAPASRRRWPILVCLGAFVAVVGLALFQPWKLFVDVTVDEAAPVVAPIVVAPSPATPPTALAIPGTTSASAAPETAATAPTAPDSSTVPSTISPGSPASTVRPPSQDPQTSKAPQTPTAPVTAPPPNAPPTTVPPTTVPPTTTPPPTTPPTTTFRSTMPTAFISHAHGTDGLASIVATASGPVLRIENWKAPRFPDSGWV